METKITKGKGTRDFELEGGPTYIGNGIIASEIRGGGGVRTQKSDRTYRGRKRVTK